MLLGENSVLIDAYVGLKQVAEPDIWSHIHGCDDVGGVGGATCPPNIVKFICKKVGQNSAMLNES